MKAELESNMKNIEEKIKKRRFHVLISENKKLGERDVH